MNDNPLERDIEKRVCSYAREQGVLTYKFTSPSQRHVPDRLMLYGGRVWFVEVKRKGQSPTAAQAIEHEKMRAKGAVIYVVDSVEQGKRIVDLEVMT